MDMIQFLAKDYPYDRFKYEIKAMSSYFEKQWKVVDKFLDFDLLISDLENIAQLLPKLGDIDKFIYAAEILHIDVSGDADL